MVLCMRNRVLVKKAFALSIVLWIVAALLLGVTTLSIFTKDALGLSKGISEKLNSRIVAENVLEMLKFYILTARNDQRAFYNGHLQGLQYTFPTSIVVDNRWYSITKNIRFRISDNANKMSLSSISPELVSNLLMNDVSRQERFILKDSLKDWLDKDNIPTLNGAEQSQYKLKKGLNYNVRNGNAIQNIQELRLIYGFKTLNKQQWKILEENFCIGNSGRVNLTYVSEEYLQALLRIDEETAKALVKYREESYEKYEEIITNMKSYDDESMGFFISKNLFIEIEVKSIRARTTLEVQLDIKNYLKRNSQRILHYIIR